MNRHLSARERKIARLLRDFGYRIAGDTLLTLAMGGYGSRVFRTGFRSVQDAAEYLVPIIMEREYTERLDTIYMEREYTERLDTI